MQDRTIAILMLILALLFHLVEEVKTGFRKRLPVGEMSRLVFVGLNVMIYAFCSATLALSMRSNRWAVTLAWVFALSMLFNGLGHIGLMVIKGQYFPGGLTAFLLILLSGYLMLVLSH